MKHFFTLLFISFLITSCSKDKPKETQKPNKEEKVTKSTKEKTPFKNVPKLKEDPSDKNDYSDIKEDPKVVDQKTKDLVPGVKYRKPDLTRPKPLKMAPFFEAEKVFNLYSKKRFAEALNYINNHPKNYMFINIPDRGSKHVFANLIKYSDKSDVFHKLVEKMIFYGANLNEVDLDRRHPILAALNNDTKILELLLRYGADPNYKTKDGSTVFSNLNYGFFRNASSDKKERFKLLLEFGANPNVLIPDGEHKGKTFLDVAMDRSWNSVEEYVILLKKYGAKTSAELKAEKK